MVSFSVVVVHLIILPNETTVVLVLDPTILDPRNSVLLISALPLEKTSALKQTALEQATLLLVLMILHLGHFFDSVHFSPMFFAHLVRQSRFREKE